MTWMWPRCAESRSFPFSCVPSGWVPGFYLGKRTGKRILPMIVRERHIDFDVFLFIGT